MQMKPRRLAVLLLLSLALLRLEVTAAATKKKKADNSEWKVPVAQQMKNKWEKNGYKLTYPEKDRTVQEACDLISRFLDPLKDKERATKLQQLRELSEYAYVTEYTFDMIVMHVKDGRLVVSPRGLLDRIFNGLKDAAAADGGDGDEEL